MIPNLKHTVLLERSRHTSLILFVILFLFLSQRTTAQLVDKSSESGFIHVHKTSTLMGGGVSIIDYNNDGFEDIYVSGGINSDQLFANLGDGTFWDVSDQAGINSATKDYTFGAIAGDINNDGCDDLFVCTYDDSKSNILLINNCDGTFFNISNNSGISHKSFSSGATFIDINNDALLDIYVLNYIEEFQFIADENGIIVGVDGTCLKNFLYVNQGDNKFLEMSEEYGVEDFGCGLAVTATDYDLDGDQDLYVVNDHGSYIEPNAMYQNDYPENSFSNVSKELGLDIGIYGMGIAMGDVDNDGFFDYYVTNLGDNAYLSNNSNEYFVDTAEQLGIENGSYDDSVSVTGWGTFFWDYDNDSDLDLYISNGYIRAGYFGIITTRNDSNKLYENVNGSFVDVTTSFDLNNDGVGRGTAYADFNNDGSLDFVLINAHETDSAKSVLYINENENNHNWLKIKLESLLSNRNAFGTRVTVHFSNNKIVKELRSGGSHASQHSQILHFGLKNDVTVDSLLIDWASGNRQVVYDLDANYQYYLMEDNEILIMGCTEESSDSYSSSAQHNSLCSYDRNVIFGCTDIYAENYNSNAIFDDGMCSYDFSDTQDSIVVVTSINDNLLHEDFLLYPIPSKDKLYISSDEEYENVKVEISSLTGRVVYTSVLLDLDQAVLLNDLSEGLYFLSLYDKNGGLLVKTKFIKSLN